MARLRAHGQLLEIDADGFRRVILANPSVLERVTNVTSARQGELNSLRETQEMRPASGDAGQSFLARVRQFLRL